MGKEEELIISKCLYSPNILLLKVWTTIKIHTSHQEASVAVGEYAIIYIKNIQYKKFQIGRYLKSNLFTNYEVQTLSKLRSRNIDVKANFKTKYTFDNVEKLECSLGCPEVEDQQHILKCKPLIDVLKDNSTNISYDDIFSTVKKQKLVTQRYISLLDLRSQLLENQN